MMGFEMNRRRLLALLLFAPPARGERRGEVYRLRRPYNFAARRSYPALTRQLGAAPFVHTLPVQLLIDKPAEARERAADHDRRLAAHIRRQALDPPPLPPSEEILVKILSEAQDDLDLLDDRIREEAMRAILDLAEDPFPEGSILLERHTGLYRVRFYREGYRIVYRVSEKQRRVVVTRIRPRGTAYRGL